MGKIIFITGGVRSGKSHFAESYVSRIAPGQAYYIATGVAFDEEMQQRIKKHQLDRAKQPFNWETLEMELNWPKKITKITTGDVVLFECVTTWLSNLLYYTENLDGEKRKKEISKHLHDFKRQLQYWRQNKVNVLIVSNEVLDDLPSQYEEVELYKRILGELHQWIVKFCDEAYEIESRFIHRWK